MLRDSIALLSFFGWFTLGRAYERHTTRRNVK